MSASRGAVALREPLLADASCMRLINAESDGLPGVIADRYGDCTALQLTSAGAVHAREALVAGLGCGPAAAQPL